MQTVYSGMAAAKIVLVPGLRFRKLVSCC